MSASTGLWAPLVTGFLLVLIRMGALMSVAPLAGARAIPGPVRIMIALPASFAIFAGAGYPAFGGWDHMGALMAAAASESLIGLAAGAGMKLITDAAFIAGHLSSTAMGLGYGSLVDPVEGADTTAVAELYTMMVMAALLAAGGHRELMAFVARISQLPPGTGMELRPLVAATVGHALQGIVLGIRLAYPCLAAVMIGQVALGIVGRTAPQLNLASLGFSVTILTGGGVAYLTAPVAAEMVSRAALAALHGAG